MFRCTNLSVIFVSVIHRFSINPEFRQMSSSIAVSLFRIFTATVTHSASLLSLITMSLPGAELIALREKLVEFGTKAISPMARSLHSARGAKSSL